LFMRDFVPPAAQHVSIGMQRQVAKDFLLTGDFVFRHFLHEMLRGVDLNHFRAVEGPVIPKCAGDDVTRAGVNCSNGPINASISGANSTYKGLLMRAEKRWSARYQTQVAYALQDQQGVYGILLLTTPITNLKNWMQNVGPQLPRHLLTASGVVGLPKGFQVSFISSVSSREPFQPVITGTDFHGTGVDQFLLPGSGTNRFNFGLGRADLVRLVDQYNQTYAGKPGPNPAQVFPRVGLPSKFDFGRAFASQDLRVSKRWRVPERVEWQLLGEVFNVFNFANLRGYVDNLIAPSFGQPSSRTSNVFGTGGPRAFQFGGRVSF